MLPLRQDTHKPLSFRGLCDACHALDVVGALHVFHEQRGELQVHEPAQALRQRIGQLLKVRGHDDRSANLL